MNVRLAQWYRRLDPRLRSGLLLLLAAGAYEASIELSDVWTPQGAGLPLLWLPIGFGYAFVAAGGRRFLLAIAGASLAEGIGEGRGWWETLLFAAGSTLAVVAICEVVRRFGRMHGERTSDTLLRMSASVVGAAVGAVTLSFAVHAGRQWPHLFLAQLTGILVAAPFARTWLRRGGAGVGSRRETAVMLVATAATAELVCSGALGGEGPLTYLMFPPLVWAALRTGRRGVGAAAFATAVVAASNATAGKGPFATSDTVLALDTFLLVATATGLLLVGIDHARRRNQLRFRMMIENATDLVGVFAADRTISYFSPSSERILGYRPEELVGRDILDFIHPDDHELAAAYLGQALAGEPVAGLLRFGHRDGRWVDLDGQARDLSDVPEIGGVIVNARDVTARRQAERELAAAEQRYRELVERLPLAIYLRPLPGGGPTYMSPQIEALLGYPVEQWLRHPELIFDLIHPEDRDRVAPWLADDGSLAQVEFRVRAADGRYVWVLNQRSPICDESGALVAYQGCVLDITERKALEEQLQQAQRLESLGLLAGGVAHDFNNLLTAISGYTELVHRRVGDDAAAQRDLEAVLDAARRASELTHQLLAFGRRQTMVTAVTSLNEVVARTQRLLTRAIDERIAIVCHLAHDLHLVRADAGQIEQVIVNLALNARDAMDDGGTLTIETENVVVADEHGPVPPGEYAVVSVSDTGAGFDSDVRERLFEPFFTTKEIGKGTGLGLSVVFGIVEQSRGHILVESEPGAGSRFRVLLPRTDDVVADAPPPVRPVTAAGTETVLLVEDEEIVRTLTATMLETSGYRVIAAATPAEALAVEEEYDLLLTDVVMPGMSGPELWKRLVERGRQPGVIFTSGYSAAVVADRDELPGELLEKPFSRDELARRVRAALDAAETVAAA